MSSSVASLLLSLATMLPVLIVLLVGTILAHIRWRRHPPVSAWLAGGLYGLLLLSLVHRIGAYLIFENVPRSGTGMTTMGLYLSLLAMVAMLLRAGAWAAVFVALFGWRQSPQGGQGPPPFQFSIFSLMLLTLGVALVCVVVRALIVILGESAMFLLQLVDDIPLFLCWIGGLVVAISRWKRHPQVSLLVTVAIGMYLVSTLVWQALWIWIATSGNPFSLGLVTLVGVVSSTVAWTLLLVAAFGWRDSVQGPGKELEAI